jgi:hypothetical protein
VFVSHFPRFSVFSPYSRSYNAHFSFFKIFCVSRHISIPTVCVSHFPRFSVFFALFQVKLCSCQNFQDFHFTCFSVFLAIFQVLPCEFHIFLVCQFYWHIPSPTVCLSHFPFFFQFSHIVKILGCAFLIFHIFQ